MRNLVLVLASVGLLGACELFGGTGPMYAESSSADSIEATPVATSATVSRYDREACNELTLTDWVGEQPGESNVPFVRSVKRIDSWSLELELDPRPEMGRRRISTLQFTHLYVLDVKPVSEGYDIRYFSKDVFFDCLASAAHRFLCSARVEDRSQVGAGEKFFLSELFVTGDLETDGGVSSVDFYDRTTLQCSDRTQLPSHRFLGDQRVPGLPFDEPTPTPSPTPTP